MTRQTRLQGRVLVLTRRCRNIGAYILFPMRTWVLLLLLLPAVQGMAQLHGRAKLDSLHLALEQCQYDSTYIRTLSFIAHWYGTQQPDTGIWYGEQCLRLARQIQWPVGEYIGLVSIAQNQQFKGQHPTANANFLRALAIQQAHQRQIKGGGIRSNLMVSYTYLDELEKAVGYGIEALRLFDPVTDGREIATIHTGLGVLQHRLSDYDKALHHHGQALAFYEKAGDREGQARVYGNMATVHSTMSSYEQSLMLRRKALDLYAAVGQRRGMAINLVNLAVIQIKLCELSDAFISVDSAATIINELKDDYLEAVIHGHLGDIHFRSAELGHDGPDPPFNVPWKDRLLLARDHLRTSVAMHEKAGRKTPAISNALSLAATYELLHEPWQALELHKHAAQLKKEIWSDEKRERIAKLEADHQQAMHEKEIELHTLRADRLEQRQTLLIIILCLAVLSIVTIINRHRLIRSRDRQMFKYEQEAIRTEKELFAKRLLELEVKALRAQMDPHFIFNCLNAIQAIILKQDHKAATDYLQKFSRLIRLILENSRKQATTLEDEAEILSLYLDLERLRLRGRFSYEIDIAADVEPALTEFPSMVVQPLVENSIWHGLLPADRPGSLRIAFHREEGELVCEVQDDGIGMERSRRMKRDGHNSQGLRLIEERLQVWGDARGVRCGLKVREDSAADRGSSVKITIGSPVAADIGSSIMAVA
jgi:tetratricopeptide (TPR) repeat protein